MKEIIMIPITLFLPMKNIKKMGMMKAHPIKILTTNQNLIMEK